MTTTADRSDKINADACPGCGCRPGNGTTSTCYHPDGCGFFKTEEAKRPVDTKELAECVADMICDGGETSDILRVLVDGVVDADVAEAAGLLCDMVEPTDRQMRQAASAATRIIKNRAAAALKGLR